MSAKYTYNHVYDILVHLASWNNVPILLLQEKPGWFSHVFVDEAAQSMEPETLIPLTVAKAQASRGVKGC